MSNSEIPKVTLYKGVPLENYTKEELIDIAKEGWEAYARLLESNIQRAEFLVDLITRRR